MTAKKAPKAPVYRVLVGANFPGKTAGEPERRVNKGDTVDDLPQYVADVLLEQGAIEEVTK